MRYVNLGRSGLQVSKICFGMMGYGDPNWRPWVVGEDVARQVIPRAIELGVNFFDTADLYSAGVSEELLGKLLRDCVRREEVVVATKAYFPTGDSPNESGLSRKHLIHAVDSSLKRLGFDYIDIFYIHRWNYSTPIEETLRILDELVKSGKILYLGASSIYSWQCAKALYLSDKYGWSRFIAVQNHYNLLYREEEREMIPLCLEEGVGIIPWSPLARGLLTRASPKEGMGETLRAKTDDFMEKLYEPEKDFTIIDRLQALSHQRCIPAAQLALAWLFHKKGVVAPIIGSTNISHLEQAVKALDISLSENELHELEKSYLPHSVVGIAPYGNDLYYRK